MNIKIQQVVAVVSWVLIFSGITSAWAGESPRVVVSIAPIHSLVAGVMSGVAEPNLLLKTTGTPHGYMLKPSQVRDLQQADVIVWVGESMESFLPRILSNLDDGRSIIELMDVPGMTLLPARAGGVWQHDHGEAHGHGDMDGHLWLDPGNAKIIVEVLVERLSVIDPQHKNVYQFNGKAMQQALTELDEQLKRTLAAVSSVPYLVFHDAYNYLEHAYGLNSMGAIMIDPEHKPGARRLIELRQKVEETNARCVFREPQFPEKLVNVVIEGFGIHSASLDPIGISLIPGKDLYFELMNNIGMALVKCLEEKS